MKIKHVGVNRYRLRQNPAEKVYSDMWADYAPQALGYLLCGQERSNHNYSSRDAEVAATVIQWLGSPVGSSFVQKCLEDIAAKSKRRTRA